MSISLNLLTSVIHTDVLRRGVLVPSGHADYYANGGLNQPGCYEQTALSPGSCNHIRAPEYYAESIYSDKGFWGFRCGNLATRLKVKVVDCLFTFASSSLVSLRARLL